MTYTFIELINILPLFSDDEIITIRTEGGAVYDWTVAEIKTMACLFDPSETVQVSW